MSYKLERPIIVRLEITWSGIYEFTVGETIYKLAIELVVI